MQYLGYVGIACLALCWIPQSLETIRRGMCSVNTGFLYLSALGSLCLMIYAISIRDGVFIVLNILTTAGALLNLFYKFAPRISR